MVVAGGLGGFGEARVLGVLFSLWPVVLLEEAVEDEGAVGGVGGGEAYGMTSAAPGGAMICINDL